MGKYVAVGVLAVIVLAAATYESPNKKTTTEQAHTEASPAEGQAPQGPVFEATFGPAEGAEPAPPPLPVPLEPPPPAPAVQEQPAAPQGAAEIAAAGKQLKEYTVKAGQTLCDISQELFGERGKWKALYEANKDRLPSPDQIRAGMKLVYDLAKDEAPAPAAAPRAQATAVPASAPRPPAIEGTHTVAKGETLYAIARKVLGKGARWKEIAELNRLDGGMVRVGQVLQLPTR